MINQDNSYHGNERAVSEELARTGTVAGARLATMIALAPAFIVTTGIGRYRLPLRITDYKVTPSVLMPDSLGTITITIKNTAASASISEKTGQLSPDNQARPKTTDINVNIENVQLEGNGIDVLSNDFERVGELGPGQSIHDHLLDPGPVKERDVLSLKSGLTRPVEGAQDTRSRSMSTPQSESRNRRS